MVERIKAQVAAEHDEVRELGGLYVVGTERHESRRIDNQLRSLRPSGRPGESRFYLSLQDEMMRLFKSEWVDRILTVLKVPDDVPIDAKRVSNAIAGAQANIESQNFESRKNVLKYDDVMSRQREVIYAERRRVLEAPTSASRSAASSTTWSRATSAAPPRATPRTGTSTRCSPRSASSTRWASPRTGSSRRPGDWPTSAATS